MARAEAFIGPSNASSTSRKRRLRIAR